MKDKIFLGNNFLKISMMIGYNNEIKLKYIDFAEQVFFISK